MTALYRGKILKIYNSLYIVVNNATNEVVTCHKQKKIEKIVVGDNVFYEKNNDTGNILKVEDRNNCLLKPEVANVDQVFVVASAKSPIISNYQLDSFLVFFNDSTTRPIILFNKLDLVNLEYQEQTKLYKNLGYECHWISAENLTEENRVFLLSKVAGKTVVFAGHSGVGKSTLIKKLFPEAEIKIGEISERLKRGKQTTKQTALYYISNTNTFLADTPGFSQVDITYFTKEEIKNKFFEFSQYQENCKFGNCNHLKEPNCGVKEAVAGNQIPKTRYDSYLKMIDLIEKNKKR
ncbi:MAG: ribosome small subunit-dependent GTPase A [Candidatus Margulisbacteria bacterium GWF2_35_9]|nr:MAG: ribosome small subunit-dependent GTPase A [Candidatus Margulisbacteria bacterium GWF2_35_9]